MPSRSDSGHPGAIDSDLRFTDELLSDGVLERRFEAQHGTSFVPGILWTPPDLPGPRPMVLMAHGAGQNSRVEHQLSMARRLARQHGFASVAIDAPGHGRHPHTDFTLQGTDGAFERAGIATEDWRVVVNALSAVENIGGGPIAFFGLSMGTALGVTFVAEDPRIRAAVLGLAGLLPSPRREEVERLLATVTVPILFVTQWDDELMTREASIDFFNALGASEKTMHINPGRHAAVPPFEADAIADFLARHIGALEPSI